MPAAAPAERMISLRRAMPVSLPAAASCAMTVLRASSVEGPSCRCCTETSSGKNFFTYEITAMPSVSTQRPKDPPISGV